MCSKVPVNLLLGHVTGPGTSDAALRCPAYKLWDRVGGQDEHSAFLSSLISTQEDIGTTGCMSKDGIGHRKYKVI
jgi:hypothetical protein